MKKRLLITVLLLTMVAVITACGNRESGGTTSQNSESVSSSEDASKDSENSEETSSEITSENDSSNENLTETTEQEQQTTGNNSSEVTESETITEEPSSEEDKTQDTSESTTNSETTDKKPSGGSSKDETSTKDETTSKDETTQNPGNTSELSKLVKKALGKIIKSDMSELEKVLVIHDYITYNVDYDYDNYLNNTIPGSSYTAYGALTTGRAVCSGYAYLFLEMAKEAGLDVEYVEGTANNGSGKSVGHAWNQVKINGAWYNMDTCWDDGTWEGKKSDDHSANGYSYCLVSDSTLYKDHQTNTKYVHKCSNGYDTAAFAKALAKVSTYKAMVYVEDTEKFEEAINNMVTSGKNTFSILVVNDGTDYWDQITTAIAKVKQPLWVISYNSTQAVVEYKIGVKENVYIAGSASEAKKAIEAYKGKLDKLELWYYDASLNEDNSFAIVNEALYKTGYNVEVESMTLVRAGKVECHIKEIENVLRIADLAEAVDYLNSNGIDSLKSKYIWYATKDTELTEFGDTLREAFISSGYLVEYDWNIMNYSELIKFKIADARKVKYISGVQDLVNYVNNIGLANLVGKEFYIKNSKGDDALEVVRDMFTEAQYPVDFTLSDWGKVIGVEVTDIYDNVYISADETDLKSDIIDAINKGTIEVAEFRLTDKTGRYSQEDIKEIIESMDRGVVMDIIWYYEKLYHVITGARFV